MSIQKALIKLIANFISASEGALTFPNKSSKFAVASQAMSNPTNELSHEPICKPTKQMDLDA
jgi:hypothetical protein